VIVFRVLDRLAVYPTNQFTTYPRTDVGSWSDP
jgi:hypothetical protein